MHLFEALTIALAGQVVLAAAIIGAARPRWMDLLPLAVLLPLAAHLFFEGPRWQMAPAYVVALAAAAVGIAGYGRARRPGARQPKVAGRLAAFMGILLLAASVVLIVTRSPR